MKYTKMLTSFICLFVFFYWILLNVNSTVFQLHSWRTLCLQSCSPVFSGVRVARSVVFCVLFVRSLFVLLSFFIWSLCCLSFDLRILSTPLVSSNSFEGSTNNLSYQFVVHWDTLLRVWHSQCTRPSLASVLRIKLCIYWFRTTNARHFRSGCNSQHRNYVLFYISYVPVSRITYM